MLHDPPHIGAPGRPESSHELHLPENDDDEEEELEKLESEVKQMAEMILDYRTNLSEKLRSSFASLLSAQRPLFPEFECGSDPGPSTNGCDLGSVEEAKSCKSATLSERDQKTAEKARLLKEKISSNISLMPIVLKRMKECMSKIEKLDSSDEVIHPAFKRKKTR